MSSISQLAQHFRPRQPERLGKCIWLSMYILGV